MADLKDTHELVFNSQEGSGLPVRTKQRSRKRYSEERRKEVAKTRKAGACNECRRRKVRCTHRTLAETSQISDGGQLVEGTNLFDNGSHFSPKPKWYPAAPTTPLHLSQINKMITGNQDININNDANFEEKQPLGYDSLPENSQPRRKSIKPFSPEESSGYLMDDLLPKQILLKDGTTIHPRNNISLFSTMDSHAQKLQAITTPDAISHSLVGQRPPGLWMHTFVTPAQGYNITTSPNLPPGPTPNRGYGMEREIGNINDLEKSLWTDFSDGAGYEYSDGISREISDVMNSENWHRPC